MLRGIDFSCRRNDTSFAAREGSRVSVINRSNRCEIARLAHSARKTERPETGELCGKKNYYLAAVVARTQAACREFLRATPSEHRRIIRAE